MAEAALYGPWDYSERKEQFPYDYTPTYEMAAEFFTGHGLVEDWGAGVCWMAQFCHEGYRGIDGAWSRWIDEVVDLRSYRSEVPCAFMRHVLEHNADWRDILDNFVASFTDRAVLVTFIPIAPEDDHLEGPDWPVPDIAISGPDLMQRIEPYLVNHEHVDSTSQYDGEDVFYLAR